MSGNRFIDAALKYIDMGLNVVILGTRSKEPVSVHTPNGLLDATRDPDVVRGWWEMTPKCNIAIVCGETDVEEKYLTVLDFDVDDDQGVDSVRDELTPWENEHGELPETVTEITGRGGIHYFYFTDRPIAKCESNLHIDIRGVGSYTMVAPSIHPNGNEVQWENHPDDYEIAWADENVYALIEHIQANVSDDGGNEDGDDGNHDFNKVDAASFKPGGRNKQLYRMAAGLMSQSWDDDAIIASIETFNSKSSDPLPKHEVDKILKSALKLPKGKSAAFYDQEIEQEDGTVTKVSRKSHVAIAHAVMDKYCACYLDGMPAVFDGLMYKVGWDSVERAILEIRRDATDKARNEVIKYLRLVMPQKKSSPPNYIGFTNGVLDIDTMELLSFSPDMRILNVIPHDWNPKARCDVLDATIRRIACGDPYIETNLFEFMGLCMYRSSKYAYAAVLLGRQGETASNGKSTYIDILRNILGEENYSALDLNELGQRFQQGHLAGKLANLGDDISSEFARGANLTVFKKAVAGTEITTDVKNRAGYKFTPYCTMVFSANKFPKLETPDDGVMRRLFPIRFNAHFTPQDEDFDPDIGEKLKSEEALEAAIVRGISGLKRVIANKRPTPNDESESMANAIKVENSSILQWIEDMEITRDDFIDGWTTKGAYDSYVSWCHESGIRNPYGKPQFGVEVCNHFKLKTYATRDENRRGVRRYRPL